jgi:stage III sporulation protein AB
MGIKWICGICIVAASSFLGFQKAGQLSRRCQSLLQLQSALSVLKGEIGFSANHLKRAFLQLSKLITNGALFSDAAEAIEEKGSRRAWQESIKKHQKPLCLEEADVQALLVLGAELGRTDRENQIKNIRHVEELLKAQYTEAKMQYDKMAKLYRGAGVLAGVFAVIVLM